MCDLIIICSWVLSATLLSLLPWGRVLDTVEVSLILPSPSWLSIATSTKTPGRRSLEAPERKGFTSHCRPKWIATRSVGTFQGALQLTNIEARLEVGGEWGQPAPTTTWRSRCVVGQATRSLTAVHWELLTWCYVMRPVPEMVWQRV